ncbi:hypothetical protein LP416_17115 [Polaromonas sp. P2-4]|nr:hypothetical protein LP416_17115 [Polaromonas sp. P2-4]
MPPPSAIPAGGSIQQGLSAAGGALGFFQLGLAADKRYSLNIMLVTRVATTKVQCPCCGFSTLGKLGDDEICQVCFWHDDGQDDTDADSVLGGPNGLLSLSQARANFKAFGASERRWLSNVRAPRPEERHDAY